MHTHFALADETALALVHEFDGVLDGEDMALRPCVDVVHHRGERGALATACLASDQDEAVGGLAQRTHGVWHGQFVQGLGAAGNDAEHRTESTQMAQHVHAKACDVWNGMREIGAVALVQTVLRALGHDLEQHFLHGLRLQGLGR